ncbi:UNVERIFIED_CONTAM: putative late blight resistance proteinR1A-10 [Sesamum latifolium]|uniref:Late blight resistance proteinR1A-10 n=1 Tax=Sesamum latifolium TaxID=2727402 RepID=A0AAW2UXI2_9LAMI
MAYAALISLLQTLEESPQPMQKIPSHLLEKVRCLLGILDDSAWKNSLSIIRDLEGKIRDASFEAQDIIESDMLTQLGLWKSVSCGVGSCFWEIISALQHMFPAIHLCDTSVNLDKHKGLQKVKEKFASILAALSKIKDGIEEAPGARNSWAVGSLRFIAGNKSTPVGLDQDLLHLKDRLAGFSSNLDIISIVGMGGIGKTTLARNLYNDRLIEDHFDTRAWVVVSQDYNVQDLFMILVISTMGKDGSEVHEKSVEELADRLYKNLKGRRYLIVMDDIWDIKAWDDVKRFFPDDNNSSRVILTTRQSEVAIYANPGSPIHHMSLLSPEASWDLLRETVFGQEDGPCESEKIGRAIAENCKGLPLAIVVVGGLLSRDIKGENWEHIAQDVNSAIARNDGDHFMEILSLSYNSLPHHLKPCFLYMGVFPEDYEIFVSQLIKLWVAEGFIKPRTPKSLEELAEDYLSDLINRSLVEVRRRKHNGEIKTLIIHDMLRELCLRKAQDEKFLQIINSQSHGFPHDRNNQRRVLNALTIRFSEFPIGILEDVSMFHPDDTLYLPSTIWKMPQLRHLLFERGFLCSSSFEEIIGEDSVVLENLQTLSDVTNLKCTKEVLEIMPNLKKLGISYVHNSLTEWSSYEFKNFIYLHKLETFKCVFVTRDASARQPLPLNIAFPPNLKKLTLSGCRISWERMTVVGSLSNLEVLKLRDNAFEGSVWEPDEGEFTKLKYLLIESDRLEHWCADHTHFPQLQHLCLSFCSWLKTIPPEIGDIGSLEMIELFECSSSAVASAMLIQEEQQSLGNEGLRVRVNSYDDYFKARRNTSLRKVTA